MSCCWKRGLSGRAVWLSIRYLVFLLNLALPVSFLESEGLAFHVLGDKRGKRPVGVQQLVHVDSLKSWFRDGNPDTNSAGILPLYEVLRFPVQVSFKVGDVQFCGERPRTLFFKADLNNLHLSTTFFSSLTKAISSKYFEYPSWFSALPSASLGSSFLAQLSQLPAVPCFLAPSIVLLLSAPAGLWGFFGGVVFFVFGGWTWPYHTAYRILVSHQGSNLCPLKWNHGILTTGPPGEFLRLCC